MSERNCQIMPLHCNNMLGEWAKYSRWHWDITNHQLLSGLELREDADNADCSRNEREKPASHYKLKFTQNMRNCSEYRVGRIPVAGSQPHMGWCDWNRSAKECWDLVGRWHIQFFLLHISFPNEYVLFGVSVYERYFLWPH